LGAWQWTTILIYLYDFVKSISSLCVILNLSFLFISDKAPWATTLKHAAFLVLLQCSCFPSAICLGSARRFGRTS
jgi:hypothetical protein